jgi:hypothetical protein
MAICLRDNDVDHSSISRSSRSAWRRWFVWAWTLLVGNVHCSFRSVQIRLLLATQRRQFNPGAMQPAFQGSYR